MFRNQLDNSDKGFVGTGQASSGRASKLSIYSMTWFISFNSRAFP